VVVLVVEAHNKRSREQALLGKAMPVVFPVAQAVMVVAQAEVAGQEQ
jgi:hypothetical protein